MRRTFWYGCGLCDTNCDYDLCFSHFDRRATKWPEVEKSIKKISRLRFAALEMTHISALIIQNWYETLCLETEKIVFV